MHGKGCSQKICKHVYKNVRDAKQFICIYDFGNQKVNTDVRRRYNEIWTCSKWIKNHL